MSRWRSDGVLGLLFCTPAILLLVLSVALPFLVAFAVTLTDQRLLSPNPTRFVGLENYHRLLALDVVRVPRAVDGAGEPVVDDTGAPVFQRLRSVLRARGGYRGYRRLTRVDIGAARYVLVARDPIFYRSLFNTFWFVALVIPLQCGTALALALVVNQAFPGRTFFRTMYFAPVVTSMVVVSIVWSLLYNTNDGLINHAIRFASGGYFVGIDWLGSAWFALPALVIMSSWQGAGFQMLIFLSGLQSIDPALYEAARMDGAGAWQRFVHVTLPGLRNTTIFVTISTTIAAFGLFTQVDVMTQGGPHDSTSTLIFHAIRSGIREQDVAYGSAVAVVFFILVLGVALLQRALTEEGVQ